MPLNEYRYINKANAGVDNKAFDQMTAVDSANIFEDEIMFDREGSGYDHKTANEIKKLWPLTMPKPVRKGRWDRETLEQDEEAFEAWVWHDEFQDWKKHSGSFDPRRGMLLKGMKHKTIDLTLEEEIRLGTNEIIFKDGRYYSVPMFEKRKRPGGSMSMRDRMDRIQDMMWKQHHEDQKNRPDYYEW